MLVVWQVLAFTACTLIGLLPSTEVDCRLNLPVAVVSPAPPPVEPNAPEPEQTPCVVDAQG